MLMGVTDTFHYPLLLTGHTCSETFDDRRRDFRGAGKAIRHYFIEHRSGSARVALLRMRMGWEAPT